MAISKTRIEKRLRKKKNPVLVDTIIKLKKTNPEAAKELARPKRAWPCLNLKEIDFIEGDVFVPGKILGAGGLSSKKKIVAWSASQKALERIKEAGAEFVSIVDEIKSNPSLEGLRIVRGE